MTLIKQLEKAKMKEASEELDPEEYDAFLSAFKPTREECEDECQE